MAGGKMKKEKQVPPWMHQRTPYMKLSKFKGRQLPILLNNRHVIHSIINKSPIRPTDVILEIAPGAGHLTEKLLEAGNSVVAVELDPLSAHDLELRFKGTPFSDRLKVIQGDVLNCNLPNFDFCVANLPLDNCSPIIFQLLSHRPLFRCAVIMVQREFALRLTAQPNDSRYCHLSANIQLLACVTHLSKIGKNNFSPQLKCDLSVVRLEPKDPPSSVNFKDWHGLVGICFLKRSKTLGSTFKLRSVLSVLEKKNNKSLRDISLENDIDMAAYIAALGNAFEDLNVEDDDEEEMEVESVDARGAEFKDRVLGVLREARLEMKRCSQLSQEDILCLLGLFNKAGIHFY